MTENFIELPWNGSYLGAYTKDVILSKWIIEQTNYYSLILDYNNETGIAYGMMSKLKNNFPLIVEDIKHIFGLQARGIHTLKIQNVMYILYYVPFDNNTLLWETPLYKITINNDLMTQPLFLEHVRKMWIFCDILALKETKESSLRVRKYNYIIHTNDICTLLESESVDYSILPKTIFNKWFGEHVSMNAVMNSMITNFSKENLLFSSLEERSTFKTLAEITNNIRTAVEAIILKHDKQYVWYIKFIIERISKLLMNED